MTPRPGALLLAVACGFLAISGCVEGPPGDAREPGSADSVATEPAATESSLIDVFLVETAPEGSPVSDIGFGCGDRLVPVAVYATREDLASAVRALLVLPDTLGLYNTLHPNELTVDSAAVSSGEARLYLSGTLPIAGICDHPRVIEQLGATARAAADVDSVTVFINGETLPEYLSLRG